MITQNDHDLLIEINTKLERAILDIKELKDNLVSDVSDLKTENEKVKERVGSLENWRWYVLGISSALTLLIPYLIQLFRQ